MAEGRVRHREGSELVPRPDQLVAKLAADEWGVLSLDELRSCGLSKREVATRVVRGRLHPRHRGVYSVGFINGEVEAQFVAAVKACGRGVTALSHFAGAAHWEFVEWDGREPEVTVRGRGTRRRPGLRIHKSLTLERRDVMRHRGVWVTTPARTLLDLAAVVDEPQLRQAVRRAQSLHRVHIRQLTQILGRMAPRRGSGRLAKIIATGPAPTRSVLEDIVLDMILRGGFEHPDVNKAMWIEGRRIIPDFRWPKQRLVVEADSRAWHENRQAREDDAVRQALLEAHGERVVRITFGQATARPAQSCERLAGAGAPKRRETNTAP